ncbi:MAG TPA: DUF2145 domain-containing protein [Gammaproteobacteria bacterium]|nr:DUF2145 domain-containing protein [Gammaproteobacteria bacterium]
MLGQAEAGSRQYEASASKFEMAELLAFSKKVENAAAKKGARVFILARQGRPASELPKGITYTHVAIAVYSSIRTGDGRTVPGYAIYNLYQDENDQGRSHLVVDYPVDYFAGAYTLKTSIIIPTVAMQKRLLKIIASGAYKNLHNPNYSVLANPGDLKYQNCTEFVLDVIQAAIYNTVDKEVIKANTRAYFTAQDINISPLKLLFGSMFVPDVKLGDQGEQIITATFTTIEAYMQKYGLTKEIITLKVDPARLDI